MIAGRLNKGDYILFDENIVQVEGVLNDTVYVVNGNNLDELPIQFCSGIPITEDILLKAGFEKNGSYKEIKLNQVSITIKFLDGEYFLVDASGWYGKGFIYLHSLQNLIYALTGTELTINL